VLGRFQFSIRFLLVATVAVAAGAAAVRYKVNWGTRSLPSSCLTLLYATAAVVGAIRTSGKLRTFWIGNALLLVVFSFHASQLVYEYLANLDISGHDSDIFWPVWCAAPLNGLFAVFLDWLFSPGRPPDSDTLKSGTQL
jgi:hypothetical protein